MERKWQDVITIANVDKPTKVKLLGFEGDVRFTYKNKVLSITAPQVNPNTVPCQFAWAYEITGALK